jgi:rare lipoprotein A
MTTITTGGASRSLLPVALALALAACAGPQAGRSVRSPAGDAAAAPATPPASRGGGYYLDDGPGANAPPDLASIPDAVPRAEPVLPRTTRPYSVFGRQYTPMTRLEPFRERGMASWYGRRYHGQPTSSGERYDMYAMTAAHPTLPIPSYVRVTSTANGRSVVVRVNDRGPFLHDRVIDLSYTAAARLGYVAAGSAEVDVELITEFGGAAASAAAASPAEPPPVVTMVSPDAAPPPPAEGSGAAASSGGTRASPTAVSPTAASPSAASPSAASPSAASPSAASPTAASPSAASPLASSATAPPAGSQRGFWLQFGAFGSLENARSAVTQLTRQLDWLGAAFDIRQEGALYKVQAGPWTRREQATATAERIRAATELRPFATFR